MSTPELFVEHLVEVFREVRRVLRSDGTLWLNLGDSYAGSWGAQSRGESAPPVSSTSANQVDAAPKRTQTGSLSRTPGLKPKDIVGIPWRVAFALQADGWYLRSDIIWAKPNPMPESVTDRPTKAHEYVFLLAKGERYFYDADAIAEPATYAGDQLGIVRGSKRSALAMGRNPSGNEVPGADADIASTRNRRSVWTIATEPTPDAHFATYPRKLVEPCILAGSPLGGIVLDPFGGSGTTGRVAEDLGRKWLLFDLNPTYAKIAKKKTAQAGLLGRVAP